MTNTQSTKNHPQNQGQGQNNRNRSNRKKKSNQTQSQSTSQNPWSSVKPKMSIDAKITAFIRELCSPSGIRKLGIAVFSTATVLNIGFWTSVTCSPYMQALKLDSSLPSVVVEFLTRPSLELTTALTFGLLISAGSTIFQLYPISQGGRSMFSELLASAFRPQTKHLPQSARVDSSRIKDYNESHANFNKTMKTARSASFAIEIAAGIMTIGSVMGGGFAGLFKLATFVYSVVGAEIGFGMARQADEVALTAEGKAALLKLERKAVDEVNRAINQ